MPSNFSSLRSSRKNLLSKLAEQAKAESTKSTAQDERFWKLTVDPKTKIGYARLRFLPASQDEDLAWARFFKHAFQGPSGNWLIENCPTTLNNPCPICKENNRLWNSGIDSDKQIVSKRKRQQKYVSNILVIEDPANPDNNGKVFLFTYGPKIHEKIMELIEPQFPDQEPTNPFDFWEGADYKLKSRDQGGFQNYDKSEFDKPAPLFGGDEAKMEAVWEKQHKLAEFTNPKQFKTFEELEKKLTETLSATARPKTAEEAIKQEREREADAAPTIAEAVAKDEAKQESRKRPAAKKTPAKPAPVVEEEPADEDGDDEAKNLKDFFAGLDD